MNRTNPQALLGGLLTQAVLPGYGKFVRGVETAAAGEAVYEGGQAALESRRRENWHAGLEHPRAQGVVSTDTYQVWVPKPGLTWEDTRTTEPRRFQ